MKCALPADWRRELEPELRASYFAQLGAFVDAERAAGSVFPPEELVFSAFERTPFDAVRVLLLGQDPYHDDGQAHGLSFSVRAGVRPPRSLANIFKEMKTDLQLDAPNHGTLSAWADQGVLLLNTVLTVRAHQPASHRGKGWEKFTDSVIRALSRRERPLVFLLWGGFAQKKAKLVDATRHRVHMSAHPSPLSASRGFFGSRPFSQINTALTELGQPRIDWQLG